MDTFTGQEIVGKKVKSFRRLYEHEDWEILFEDGAELRIFGNAMMPSFLGHNVKGMPADQNAPQSEAKDKAGHRLASPACSASDLAWTFELLDDNNEVATAFTISPKCKKLYAVGSVLQLLAEEAKKLGVSDSLARVRVRAHKFNEVV